MEEEKDTPVSVPEGQELPPAGHADETPDSPAVETVQPAEAQVEPKAQPEGAPAPEAIPSRYLGKKYSDLTEYDTAYDNAQRKIEELGKEKNLLSQQLSQLTGLQPEVEQQSQVSVQEIETLRREIAQNRLRIAQSEEDRIIDSVVKDKPHLASVSDHIKAAWRNNPTKSLEEVIAPLEKLVSVGRVENKEDMLKKKNESVETGRQSGEAPTNLNLDKVAKAKESGELKDWADALPDYIKL